MGKPTAGYGDAVIVFCDVFWVVFWDVFWVVCCDTTDCPMGDVLRNDDCAIPMTLD